MYLKNNTKNKVNITSTLHSLYLTTIINQDMFTYRLKVYIAYNCNVKTGGLRHAVKRQVTYPKLQISFCDLVCGASFCLQCFDTVGWAS